MAELFKVNAPVRKPLFEGVQGENEARSIQFDITPWVEELGDGAVTATAKRSQDSQPYPVTVTKDGNTVTWKPTSTDTAFAGVGSFQLEYTVDDVLAKTCIWSTMVAPSLDPAGDPPDPYENWLAEMRQIAADAIQSADDAEDSAEVAEAWAVGQRGGVDVPSTDETYHNNSKYWAEQSAENQYGAYIVKSASGDIASFADGGDDVPMKSVNVTITPKQSGSGDPSPTNVRPISGTSTANVFVTGKNLFGGEYAVKYDLFIPAGQAVTVSAHKTGSANLFFAVYNQSGSVIDYWTVTNTSGTRNYRTFTFAYDVYGVRFYNSASDDMQIELGSTPTDYAPYTGTTTPVTLGQTVYGGTVELISGELEITDVCLTLTGEESGWANAGNTSFYNMSLMVNALAPSGSTKDVKGICSHCATNSRGYLNSYIQKGETYGGLQFYDTANYWGISGTDLASKLNYLRTQYANGTPVQIKYELATPTTVQLTPTQVATLLGANNVWADCGSVEVEYRADPTLAYNELANVIVSLGGNL